MKEWFYTITQSMVEMGLQGTELNLFAVLYGYSQRGDGCYYGTRGELAARCGVASRRTIDAALDSLMEKGYIRKNILSKDGVSIAAYSVCAKIAQGEQKLHTPPCKNCTPPRANSAHKKNKDIKENINNIIPPTPQQVSAYAKERGFIDPAGFAEHFIAYYTQAEWHLSNGRPMKDWKKAVITWEPNNKGRRFTPSPNPLPKSGKAGGFERMMDVGRELGIIGDNIDEQ